MRTENYSLEELAEQATNILDDEGAVIFDGTQAECQQLANRLCSELPELFDSQDAAMEFITEYWQDAIWQGLARPRTFTYQPDE